MSISEIAGKIFKPLLLPFAIMYGLIMKLRNLFYDKGWFSSVSFSLPVLSVGNLSTGGTGKTPHIEYLIELLQYEYRVATLSRGYKRKTQGFRLAKPGTTAKEIGDEPLQFFLKYPDIAVSVGENRLLAIPELLTHRPQTEVVLLDDAFQHRSVSPAMNIMITDYHRPFYEDYILPLGRLRESRKAYRRADVIIVSKCPADLGLEQRTKIIKDIAPLPHQEVFFTKIEYGYFVDFYTKEMCPKLDVEKVILVAGIANPTPLRTRLERDFAEVQVLDFPDHHHFHGRDINELIEVYQVSIAAQKTAIITTEKDMMRLLPFRERLEDAGIRMYVLPIKIKFLEGAERFAAKVRERVYVERVEEEPEPEIDLSKVSFTEIKGTEEE